MYYGLVSFNYLINDLCKDGTVEDLYLLEIVSFNLYMFVSLIFIMSTFSCLGKRSLKFKMFKLFLANLRQSNYQIT